MSKSNKRLVPLAKRLRHEMTKEERRLWYDFLRSYPVRFYRQKILGRYIVDFYCANARLVLELDGSQHFDPTGIEKDAARSAFLSEYGLQVIHIPNNYIKENFRGVCEYIDFAVKQSLGSPPMEEPEKSLPCVRGAIKTVIFPLPGGGKINKAHREARRGMKLF